MLQAAALLRIKAHPICKDVALFSRIGSIFVRQLRNLLIRITNANEFNWRYGSGSIEFSYVPHKHMSSKIAWLTDSIESCSLLATSGLVKMLQSYFKSSHYLIASLLGSLLR